jgi:hypothetical protein
MEVHAHTHTPRKKWIHYFWEFLMLFLAVFCGFLAENQREHIVERQREKKYAASLFEDLKKDTADFIHDIPFWESMLKRIDTLRQEIEKPSGMRNTLTIYRLAAYMRGYNNFEYHDRTIEQLKNSVNCRLISKSVIADSLIDYDALIKSELRDQEMQSNRIYQELNLTQDKIFSSKFYYLSSRVNAERLDSAFKKSPRDFVLPEWNEPGLFQYYNHLQFYYNMNKFRLVTTINLLRRATNLISLLKEEYHLK